LKKEPENFCPSGLDTHVQSGPEAFLRRVEQGLIGRLRRDAEAAWSAYTQHEFVLALARGDLPQEDFRTYLIQDYLYLIHFTRAYALAVVKCDTLDDMRTIAATMAQVLEELPLHVSFCAEWGLAEADMQRAPESLELIAYTRFLIDRGVCGDLLDLLVALSACVVGYGEVGATLILDSATVTQANPYLRWIETYAGADYLASATQAMDMLDRVWTARGSEARYPALLGNFATSARLESAFWRAGQAVLF
jgi:thiaminase/transcriptional activator TenA